MIGTTSKHNQANGRNYSDATLYNGEEELLKVSYINSEDVYALQCKDIYEPYYIGVRNSNLKQFAINMGLSKEEASGIPDSIPLNVTDNTSKITEEERKYISDTYLAVLINSIPEEKYTKTEKTSITVNNKNYEASAYQLTLTQDDMKQMIINVLTKAKDDEQTIAILNKLVYDENQKEQINVQETIEQLLEKLKNEDYGEKLTLMNENSNDMSIDNLYRESKSTNESPKEDTFIISVYHVGKQILKTKINCNNVTEYILDLDTSQENKQYAAFYGRTLENNENSEQQDGLKLTMEKQTLNNMVNYTTNVIDEQNEYKITMTTSIGDIIDNKMDNNSKITIADGNTTIEASCYKTTQLATAEVEIQELTNSNAIIINNYPIDQLETFFTDLGEKAGGVLATKIEQLNLQLTNQGETKNSMEATDRISGIGSSIINYIEGIASSLITVANVNGVAQPIGTIGVTAIMLTNQSIQMLEGAFVDANASKEDMTIAEIVEILQLIQADVQIDSMAGDDFTNINDIKTLVEEQFPDEYEVTDWGDISFNITTSKLEGTITVKTEGKLYSADFTNCTVEEKK